MLNCSLLTRQFLNLRLRTMCFYLYPSARILCIESWSKDPRTTFQLWQNFSSLLIQCWYFRSAESNSVYSVFSGCSQPIVSSARICSGMVLKTFTEEDLVFLAWPSHSLPSCLHYRLLPTLAVTRSTSHYSQSSDVKSRIGETHFSHHPPHRAVGSQ